METVFIEATHGPQRFNHGKFMVARFTADEWSRRSVVDGRVLAHTGGWTHGHVLVLDLQTGEGAIFRPGGKASYDLGHKHQIWVCPLYEAFLDWLYQQDLTDLQKLPPLVELPDAPAGLCGYRRDRGGAAQQPTLSLADVLTGLAATLALGATAFHRVTRGQLHWLLSGNVEHVQRLAESEGLRLTDDFSRAPGETLSPKLLDGVLAAVQRGVFAVEDHGTCLRTTIAPEDATEFLARCPGSPQLYANLAQMLSMVLPPVAR